MTRRYRFVRHMMLQILLLLICMSCFGNAGDILFDISLENLPTFLTIYLFFNASCYFNIYVLTPRFFFHGKIAKYLLSVFALVMAYLLAATIVQAQREPEKPAASTITSVYDISETNTADTEAVASAPDATQPQTENASVLKVVSIISIFASILLLMLIIISPTCLLLFREVAQQNLRNSELHVSTAQTELKMLKQQINPHFLFNMINNVNVLVQRSPQEASDLLFRLEDLLRYQFADSNRENVSLKSDIQFLHDFLDLEKTRRTNFRYEIRTENIDNELFIPPLLFIPFVENAVKHNSDGENESWIEISFSISDNTLKFSCINSKPPYMSVPAKVGGLGLQNIKRRLELLYPDAHTLEINDDEKEFRVFLCINLS